MFKFRLFSLLSCLLVSSSAFALTISVVDQQGENVSDAVVIVHGDSESAAELKKVAVMDQVDKQFKPYVLSVQAGQYVSFPNSDNIRHHVYSFSESKTFEIKLYSGVPSEPLIFDKPGVVVLGCNIHDQMLGYVLVTENSRTFKTDDTGNVEIPSSAINGKIEVWHPRLKQGINTMVAVTDPGDEAVTVKIELTPKIVKKKKTFGNKFQRNGS